MNRTSGMWVVLTVVLVSTASRAHAPSDAFLLLEAQSSEIIGRWDVALRDVDLALELDANGDGALTGRELRAKHAVWSKTLLDSLELATAGVRCALEGSGHRLAEREGLPYAVFDFRGRCGTEISELEIGSKLLFPLDPQHRVLVRLQQNEIVQTGLLRADAPTLSFTVAAPAPALTRFLEFVREGVQHIWIGFDHILFLLALLLPSVLRREDGRWVPTQSLRPVLIDVARIVTAFTLAHSLTLALASLGIAKIPTQLAEVAIALSVALAALNNLRPVVVGRWPLAFALGLLHGFGFSSVLLELGLPTDALVLALVGFNVGVELGQLAIVAVFVPLAFRWRATAFYRVGTFGAGSAAIALIACVWSAQRLLLE